MTQTQVQLLNFVANQPEVLAQIAPGFKCVDLSRYLDMPGTLLYGNEHGVLMFVHDIERCYAGHYMFTDTARRREIMSLCRRAITDVFTKHNASAIKGVTPRGNLGARAMNRALGLLPCGFTTDTAGRDCIRYILERKTWQASLRRRSA